MTIEVLADVESVGRRAAAAIAAEARAAVTARGRFTVAVSGGRTPWAMLRALSGMDLPWPHMHVLQVDERIAPANHPDRNLARLEASLAAPPTSAVPVRIHPMPVDAADIDDAARAYADTLTAVAGSPPVLDLIHLGLGADGHTASLVPGDPVLDITGADVALTGVYQGRRRMTLTYPVLNRARRLLWVITGEEKTAMLARLRRGDRAIPAGRVRQDTALVVTDLAEGR